MAKMNYQKAAHSQRMRQSTAQADEVAREQRRKSRVRNPAGKVMKSIYTGWCSDCGYSIWKGDRIRYNGTATHVDCVRALNDGSNRIKKEDME